MHNSSEVLIGFASLAIIACGRFHCFRALAEESQRADCEVGDELLECPIRRATGRASHQLL
jgi:hypothetical protein